MPRLGAKTKGRRSKSHRTLKFDPGCGILRLTILEGPTGNPPNPDMLTESSEPVETQMLAKRKPVLGGAANKAGKPSMGLPGSRVSAG